MITKVDRGAKVNEAVLEALKQPRTPPEASPAPPAPRPGAQTWVGRVAHEHNAGLKNRITELERERAHGEVVLKLDPKRIQSSALANRHATSLEADDESLKELAQAIRDRGQLEPIRVRPAPAGGDFDYEIVYGHRRHAVALALDAETDGGWPVLALLDASASDTKDHVLKMYQENAARKDLSAYETGAMFRGWLAAKVFDGQTQIATATGLSEPSVSKYLTVAMLPKAVLEAFGDPRVIAVRWAERLAAAIKTSSSDVVEAARAIAREDSPLKPDVVLNRLLDAAQPKKRKKGGSQSETVKIDGRTAFAYSLKNDRIAIRFGKHVEPQIARELTGEIKDLLTKRLKAKLGRGGGS
jgi:ParB family transcriptional regulator, chromosome partitioning protein